MSTPTTGTILVAAGLVVSSAAFTDASAQQIECSSAVRNVAAVTNPSGHVITTRYQFDIPNLFRPPTHAEHHLTPHEVRLLGLLAQGHSYKTAAAALGSSVNTVAFHMKHIYAKLQVHSKSEAVARALRDRIVR